MRMISIRVFMLCCILALTACVEQSQPELSPDEAREIAKRAYVYGFPLMMYYKTMYVYAVDKNSSDYKGGFNHLECLPRVYTPDDKAVVTPNSDTPYCLLSGDMRAEPLVLTIPEIEEERFYEVQLSDIYTHNYAYVSSVATGNVPGKYLIVGPGWKGEIPEGIKEVIHSETDFIYSTVRTQLFDAEDMPNVEIIQAGYRFEPLSVFLGNAPSISSPAIEFPVWQEGDQFTAGAFTYIDFVLGLTQTHTDEIELMKEFAQIGLGTESDFELSQFSPEIQDAIADGVKAGFAELEAFIKRHSRDPLLSAKIFGTRDFLKKSAKGNFGLDDFHMLRMTAAHLGLFGNSGEEAIYPSYFVDKEGLPLNTAEKSYTIVFAADQFPPVSAFWSLTIYDASTQLLVENPLGRYLLNSTMIDQFTLGTDGSLTFYIQSESPGKALEANWLPAPNGPFYAIMRLYGPEATALEGNWVNPPMQKVDN